VDDERFAEWTRFIISLRPRRGAIQALAGSLLGGATATLGRPGLDDAKAKKKRKRKKKKRCTKLLVTCGGKKKCCKGLSCGTPVGTTGTVCCQPPEGICADASECCGVAGTNFGTTCDAGRCCRENRQLCERNGDCCTGQVCLQGCIQPGVFACCKALGQACSNPFECCDGCGNDCVDGVCCRALSQFCNQELPCCAGTVCQDGGCCLEEGDSCPGFGCCAGLTCSGGFCTP
jgi:hypothetical protein